MREEITRKKDGCRGVGETMAEPSPCDAESDEYNEGGARKQLPFERNRNHWAAKGTPKVEKVSATQDIKNRTRDLPGGPLLRPHFPRQGGAGSTPS